MHSRKNMLSLFKGCQRLGNDITASCRFSRGMFTCLPGSSINIQQNQQHQNGNQNYHKKLLQGTTGPLLNYELVRHRHRYEPKAQSRIFKFGLEARLSTRGGKEVLWRRILKGRQHLTAFDQFLEEPIPMTEQQKKELGMHNIYIPKKFYKSKDYKKNKHKYN